MDSVNTNNTNNTNKSNKCLEFFKTLHLLILKEKLIHPKAIKEIEIDDLILELLKEETEELPKSIFLKLRERVMMAKTKEDVWRKRRSIILERFKSIGTILYNNTINDLIFEIPYDCEDSFMNLIETEIEKSKTKQAEMLEKMEKVGFSATIPDLNLDKRKFKVVAVFEVEYFKNKESELIAMLEKRLEEAEFKSMPEIKVEPI
ncbi:hypothetical protein BKH42_08665 [Helicobacter sp. 13S00482-2]|uniref:hypothetical protein n=1 Tax=Helicobacter sp. 13S00482-2 TaxID=1476200 RepID=UPI000BA6F6A3|nr:hypothetical protein [Helicobacter sp. 13S00482-2]PAF52934.1 hypothetical protein BKH42_08665 [Helicobacter sp. 13S00482-2]